MDAAPAAEALIDRENVSRAPRGGLLRLLLIRHGHANRRGMDDLGLTERGRSQAEALGVALRSDGSLSAATRLLSSLAAPGSGNHAPDRQPGET